MTQHEHKHDCCDRRATENDHHQHKPQETANAGESCCAPQQAKRRPDLILWGSTVVIVASLLGLWFFEFRLVEIPYLHSFATSIEELLARMWWGLLLGFFFVGLMGTIPREFLISFLGKGGTLSGVLRATGGGLLLDLCSHGILMVGMQLYRRGASLGQVMAFLIASPWNSLSLTFILFALIGVPWTLLFILLSAVIAIISGLLFEALVRSKVLPQNPNQFDLPTDFRFLPEARRQFAHTRFDAGFFRRFAKEGWSGSKMVLRWILFGTILASLLVTFLDEHLFHTIFGPTLAGLGLTVLFATILEVCSEGSTPIAAEILTRAKAPGNSFAFLMTGVATDYTEILALKDTTRSWKIAFFLPLVTVPQVLTLAYLINQFSVL